MLLIWILRVLATVYEASATPFTGTGNQGSRRTLPSDVSHLNLLSNPSVIPSNISTKNALNVECDAAQYGDNLNITDCKDAKLYISSGSEQFAWVGRHTYYPKAHFFLPYRYLGGKYRLLVHLIKGSVLRFPQMADSVISKLVSWMATGLPTLASTKSRLPPMQSLLGVKTGTACKAGVWLVSVSITIHLRRQLYYLIHAR